MRRTRCIGFGALALSAACPAWAQTQAETESAWRSRDSVAMMAPVVKAVTARDGEALERMATGGIRKVREFDPGVHGEVMSGAALVTLLGDCRLTGYSGMPGYGPGERSASAHWACENQLVDAGNCTVRAYSIKVSGKARAYRIELKESWRGVFEADLRARHNCGPVTPPPMPLLPPRNPG